MYCENCGRKSEDNESFCPECGAEIKIVQSKKNKENLMKRRGKKQFVILFIVFVFILAGASVLFKVVKDKQYENSMEMGKKYLEEQQYEKAINSFDEAIKCSNMEVEPYWNKAKTYNEMGNAELAGQTYSQVLDVLINKIVREDKIPKNTEEICKEIIAFWGNLDTISKEEKLVEIESVLSKIERYIDDSIREELYTMVEQLNSSTVGVTDLGSVYSEGSMTSIIDANGNLIMCGLNTNGQIGSKIPEKVTTHSLVATGVRYVCGDSNLAIITKDNKLYAKEYAGSEMFSNEKNADIDIYKVADDVVDADVWGDVCAYVTNKGELYAMGSPRGSLGDKDNTTWSAEPIKIMDNIRDVELSTNDDYATTFAAITTDNELYMWGSNSSRIIKESNEDDVNKPLSIMENVKMVSLGDDYVLILTMDNTVYAWGTNNQGQLGIGNTDVTEEVVKIMEDVIYVDAGVSSSLAVTQNGELYTWGSNNYGCTGVGEGSNVEVELPVAIMDNVRTASIDGETMIILDNDGNVYTCGWNSEGQLGTGDFNDSNVPVKVYNIYESDLPGTLNDINGEIIDETYFDTMNETKIEVERNGQNLVVNMTVDHLSDFLKYNDNSISLLVSDGIRVLKFKLAVENDTVTLDDSIYILTEKGGALSWMGKYWESISCEQNTNILSWNCELPVNSFSAENVKYIGSEIFTSRHRKYVTTYELNKEQLILTDKSLENMEMAVSSSSYHQYIEE